MKVFYFFLIPLFIFAQTPDYPDTLFLKTGQIYPCLVEEINESVVSVIYQNDSKSSAALNNVEKIYIGTVRDVYTDTSGFKFNPEFIQNVISKRKKAVDNNMAQPEFFDQSPQTLKKWSFGVLYVPYYYGYKDYFFYSSMSSSFIVLSTGEFESMFESQFSYQINEKSRFTFDMGYNSTYLKEVEEVYDSYSGTYIEREIIDDMQIFVFNMGLKYYFSNLIINTASGYIQFGIGKQFASIDDKIQISSSSQNNSLDELNEFMEEVNSPFFLNLGLGAEYFFNKSLSLNASFKFVYLTYSGKLDVGQSDPSSSNDEEYEVDNSETIKRVGLGVNLYF